jgi:hypothetical protein
VKKVIVGAVFAAGVGIAGVAGAAPAMAAPVTFGCAPCVSVPVTTTNPDGTTTTTLTPTPIWTAFFDGTNGVFGDGKGAWESGVQAVNGSAQENFADATDGVPGDGQGAWEKVFPPAP